MKLAVETPLMALLMLGTITSTNARAAHDGKYSKRKYNYGNHGKYIHANGGDYVEDLDRYRYVHYDDGDRGRYIHTHIPYDGGFGNYEGGHEPFRNPPYDASGLYAYVQKPKNDSCFRLLEQYSNTCSDSSLDNPFKSKEYDIKRPSIYLEYGIPDAEYVDESSRQEKQTSAAIEMDPRASTFPGTVYLPVPRPSGGYGPPERAYNASSRQAKGATALRSVNIGSISLTTASGQESKLNLVTKVPDTTRNRLTVSPRGIPESSTSTTPLAKSSTTVATRKTFTTTTSSVATTTPAEQVPETTRTPGTLLRRRAFKSSTSATPVATSSTTVAATKTFTTTASTVARTTPPKASTEEQLYQCRSELQAALLKLSHGEHAERV